MRTRHGVDPTHARNGDGKAPEAEPAVATAATTSPASSVTVHSGGLTVKAYRGDGCVLIAMDLDPADCQHLAGFAIARSTDGGNTWTYTPNRLSLDPKRGVAETTDPNTELAQRQTSDVAPYQKFHWLDYPPESLATPFTYKVEAKYFTAQRPGDAPGALATRFAATFTLSLAGDAYEHFTIGFTRGYISSQAFADRYPNVRELRPERSVSYSTDSDIPATTPPTTWRTMYHWLGGRARQILGDFLTQCETDQFGYDVFAYDLDEPDFLRALVRDAQAGRPIRMVLDNSALHTKTGALEPESAQLLEKAGVKLVRGHFRRYAHDKCLIERDHSGNAVRVLTGSANFSVRGLYVQSNSIIRIDDPGVAALYGQAFDEAWGSMSSFASAEIASEWFAAKGSGIPSFDVSFAPHTDASISLDRVAAAIKNAKSSVLFAVMELGGGGDVLRELLEIRQRNDIFSYGVTQTTGGLKFYKSGGANGLLVPFSALRAHVPEPFRAEWNGGMGQVIHHKFVVVDFNDEAPVVFCGSSNLAQGGEESNGDNMLSITDPAIAALYAVEAIRLVDHYEFRAVASQATTATPLLLQGPAAPTPWWASSYDPHDIKNRERLLFVR
jgi:phosphatidylserine/phosphatidylglycerophosphate/cardiolipin synthase-like enzyme